MPYPILPEPTIPYPALSNHRPNLSIPHIAQPSRTLPHRATPSRTLFFRPSLLFSRVAEFDKFPQPLNILARQSVGIALQLPDSMALAEPANVTPGNLQYNGRLNGVVFWDSGHGHSMTFCVKDSLPYPTSDQASPYLTRPHRTPPYPTLPNRSTPNLARPYPTSDPTKPYPTRPCRAVPHLTPPNLTQPKRALPHLTRHHPTLALPAGSNHRLYHTIPCHATPHPTEPDPAQPNLT